MIVRPFYYFETGCAAYVFGCGGLGQCAVVDAHEKDLHSYIECAAAKGTIGFEKQWNTLLSRSRVEFVADLAVVASRPAKMEELLLANRGRGNSA